MIETKNVLKTSGIYKITNKINNKVYIGQTKNLKSRIQRHLYDFKNNKHPNIYLYNSMRKHGIENFDVEIIFQGNFNQNELNDLEIDLIRLYNSNDKRFGYNMTEGGDGISGLKRSEITKQKISKSKKGKKRTEEHNKNLKEAFEKIIFKSQKGKFVSLQTRQKQSNAQKGKKRSPQSIEKAKQTRLKNDGYKLSEEHKRKLSEAAKGKKIKKEYVEKSKKAKKFNRARKLIEENCLYEEYFYGSFVYQS